VLGRLLLHVAAPELAVYRATDGVRVRIPSGEFVLPEKPEDDLLPWTEFALTALGRTGVEFDDVALHEQLQAFEDDERAWELRVFAEMSARSARRGRTFADLRIATPDATDYIVPGFIVPGWATKLAGREKGGKGTFMYYLLGKMERGEDTVFGPTKKTTALVVTEEPIESVEEKATAFGLERGQSLEGPDTRKLRAAAKLGARAAIIIGPDEVRSVSAIVRDLSERSQQTVPKDQLVDTVRRLLGTDR